MRISVTKGIARVAAVSTTAIVLTLGFVASGAGAEPGDNGNGANASASAQGQPSDTGKPDKSRSDRGKGSSSQGASSQGKPSSEDTNSPQPPSNADYSGNGANTHGPYDSTRDGSASQNGNGDGKAKGKPCAGCVGKADNKNPPGQMPGGSDSNAGYECDTNNGVGKSNPAHTSCQEQPPGTTPPGTTPPGTTPPGTTPPGTTPPETSTAPPTTTDTTQPETTTQPAPTAPGTQPPAGGEAPEAAPETLPTTGVSAALPVLTGLAAVLIGGVLLLLGRRWASAREH